MVTDLQKKFPIPCELQDVRVLPAVAGDPDIFLVVDKNAVFVVRPLIFATWSTPSLHYVSCLIEFQNRRRWNTAVRSRRLERSIFVIVIQAPRTRCDPEVIVRI